MPFAQLIQFLLQNLLPYFTKKIPVEQAEPAPMPVKEEPKAPVEPAKPTKIVTLEEYLTACGRYPERAKDSRLDEQMLADAQILIDRVTNLMADLKIASIDITSGYRPLAVNKAVDNAAKNSAHTLCMAMDILDDKNQTLANRITPELLLKHNLYMESPKATIGKNTNWVHLQTRQTHNRIFIP